MRLIDADKLMNKLYGNLREGEVLYRISPNAIDNAPTVDAAPVVRCKDCKYARQLNEREREYLQPDVVICTNAEFIDDGWNPVWPDDFCRYGERRDT